MTGPWSRWRLRGKRVRAATPVATFDALERRTLLAATLSADGVVVVTGTDAADAFVVRLNATGADLQVTGAGPGIAAFALSAVQSLRIEGAGGDDTLTIDSGGGLVARSGVAMPVQFDGGAGSDAVVLVGTAAGVSVSETLTPGPGADAGRVVSQAGQKVQTLQFSGVESFLDTSTAASFTIKLGDASNLVEVSNGAAAGGVVTGSIRAFDVTPLQAPAAPAPAAAAPAAPAPVAPSTAPAAPAPTDASAGEVVGKAHRKKKAKPKADEKKKKPARGGKRALAAAARAAAVTQAAPAAPQQSLLIGLAYVPVQFANKAKVTIDSGGGDDWVAVDNAVPAAGLKSLTVNTGDGSDHLAEIAIPKGVTWVQQAAEDVTAVRGFVGVTAPPPTPAPPPVPTPGPTPGPTDGGGTGEGGKDQGKKDPSTGDGGDKKPDEKEKEKEDKKGDEDDHDESDHDEHGPDSRDDGNGDRGDDDHQGGGDGREDD